MVSMIRCKETVEKKKKRKKGKIDGMAGVRGKYQKVGKYDR